MLSHWVNSSQCLKGSYWPHLQDQAVQEPEHLAHSSWSRGGRPYTRNHGMYLHKRKDTDRYWENKGKGKMKVFCMHVIKVYGGEEV